MTQAVLEPRAPQPGHPLRWAKLALALLGRSPVYAGSIAFALGGLDIALTHVFRGHSNVIAATISTLLAFPILAVLNVLVRHLDRPALHRLREPDFIVSATMLGAAHLLLLSLLLFVITPLLPIDLATADNGGGRLCAIMASALFMTGIACAYFELPLIAGHRLSLLQAFRLCSRAITKAGLFASIVGATWLPGLFVKTPLAPVAIPLLLLFGVAYCYVATREVFEHREANEPKSAPAAAAARTHA